MKNIIKTIDNDEDYFNRFSCNGIKFQHDKRVNKNNLFYLKVLDYLYNH